MKRCTKCGKDKKLSQFSKDKRLKSGCSSWCKACKRDYMRNTYKGGKGIKTLQWLQLRDQEKENEKVCISCFKIKSLTNFNKGNQTSRKGVLEYCKECGKKKYNSKKARQKILRLKYGLTQKDYEKILRKQDNKCAICGTKEPKGRYHIFHIDHCHKTSKVRGLLCSACNQALGKFKDNPKILREAANYIEQHNKLVTFLHPSIGYETTC